MLKMVGSFRGCDDIVSHFSVPERQDDLFLN